MCKKISEIINIDLHIHSAASSYKEESGYVDNSNIKNIATLLEKLNVENINMFAITDHNRFDFKLYTEIKKVLSAPNNSFPNVKTILPGVEFDVELEEGKEPCHIICIFDDEKEANLKRLSEILEEKETKLIKKNDFFSKGKFEEIIKKVDLSVILIAHQHKHFDNKSGGKRSISNSVDNIYEFIDTGYINALEYQKVNVQGMIINSLEKTSKNLATVIGSDCHKWELYPYKDEKSCNKDYVSKIKSLPTFTGLVLAITSPETRFNRINTSMKDYIGSFTVDGNEYYLSKGINAIIGDNGSGKTFLLDILSSVKLKSDYKDIQKKNKIQKEDIGNPNIEYIKQNQIIDDVKKGRLFDTSAKEFYKQITTKETFKTRIKNYSKKLLNYFDGNIKRKEIVLKLQSLELTLKNNIFVNTVPTIDIDLTLKDNVFEDRVTKIKEIQELIQDEYNNNKKFYRENAGEFQEVMKKVNEIFKKLENESLKIEREESLKGLVIKQLNDFDSALKGKRTDKEKENLHYNSLKKEFAKSISEAIKIHKKENKIPKFPDKLLGSSKKTENGYTFFKKTGYDQLHLYENFLEELFINDIKNIKFSDIDTQQKLYQYLNGVTGKDTIDIWHGKVDKFIESYCAEETYIQNATTKEPTGKTPGEVATVFYDFKLRGESNDKSVILIDQPEDDISNKSISSNLIDYININREKKQIIITTHNPMLVVNLDVDNVIHLNKSSDNKITIQDGSLEYKCKDYKVLNKIAETMDGGKETIKRRFKLYDS